MEDSGSVPVKIVTGRLEAVHFVGQVIAGLIDADLKDQAEALESRLVAHGPGLLEEVEVSPCRYVVSHNPFAALLMHGCKRIAESNASTDLKRIKIRSLLQESGY
jgi:hypothetical protein